MSKALTKSFDYSIVDKDAKSDLIYFASEILKARDAAAKSIIEMGQWLSSAQERLAKPGSGVFINWVETECGFSERTAYNLIYSYRAFGDFANFAKMEDSAAYALASPSAPEKARKEAMKLANKGESITHAKAKEIIAKHKQTSSDKGKPGGDGHTSLNATPASDGPASSEPAAENGSDPALDAAVGPPGSPGDVSGDPFEPEEPGAEPAGAPGNADDEFRTQRSKTVKTIEAAMRAFSDLHRLVPRPDDLDWSLTTCKSLLRGARNWDNND